MFTDNIPRYKSVRTALGGNISSLLQFLHKDNISQIDPSISIQEFVFKCCFLVQLFGVLQERAEIAILGCDTMINASIPLLKLISGNESDKLDDLTEYFKVDTLTTKFFKMLQACVF